MRIKAAPTPRGAPEERIEVAPIEGGIPEGGCEVALVSGDASEIGAEIAPVGKGTSKEGAKSKSVVAAPRQKKTSDGSDIIVKGGHWQASSPLRSSYGGSSSKKGLCFQATGSSSASL